MNNIEIDAMALLEKLTKRISEDARTIAMLETTVDIYVNQVAELNKQIVLLKELQEQ